MVNIANVDKAIAIMERAKAHSASFNMAYFQSGRGEATTEAELHKCGNTACFAGYVALSPEFHADGGYCAPGGSPCMQGTHWTEEKTISQWLGISISMASCFIYGGFIPGILGEGRTAPCKFYGKPWDEITPDDVIAKLKLVKSGELT